MSHFPDAAVARILAGQDDPDRPILIAGPTASGKSALALTLAEATGRCVVNADALQVFDGWRILTARPGPEDCARIPHALYGHCPPEMAYSVGRWLRDLEPYLTAHPAPVIVGGTGLYFSALTEGLAEIPETRPDIRAEADRRLAEGGLEALAQALDADTRARIDLANPRRVQRAWEVLVQTGRGMACWQRDTPAPRLPLDRTLPLCVLPDRDALARRISRRFDAMLAQGLLEEALAMAPAWDPALPSAKAIGARDLIAHVRGEIDLHTARRAIETATRQYAKRQRTWFRNRMGAWWTANPL